ncbi:MAG: 5'-nucleotidase C-terminal domain-containing protein, partial [Dehalococcoidia bacterium]|nr:5'-nucleotidase C-terminal domain-containing protein [Dehalococcoidia bacterium]
RNLHADHPRGGRTNIIPGIASGGRSEGVSRSQFKDVLENAVSTAVSGDFDEFSGVFPQVAGFRFEWSASGRARILNEDGTVKEPGSRVTRVVLDSGEVIIGGGVVVPGDPITVATPDFLARGGDNTPYRGTTFTSLGVTYQQALVNYITFPADKNGLGGVIGADDYPEAGEGRITRLP